MRFTPQVRSLPWLVSRPIAHRGLHTAKQRVIENTESAFAAALSLNYAIECDVQITADGEAAVFHDEELNRLMAASGEVRALPLKRLKALHFQQGSDRIQSLGELLEQVGGRVTLIVELKSHWDSDMGLMRKATDLLANYKGPAAIMSYDPEVLEAARLIAPNLVRGIVADRVTDSYYSKLPLERRLDLRRFGHLPRTQPHFVSFRAMDLPFQAVGRIREAGHPVITWTIGSSTEAAHAYRYSDQITFEGFLPV
ncbi:MAG: glycerophosphodiester phosphodiesterase family protein [Aestuariivirga sp.]